MDIFTMYRDPIGSNNMNHHEVTSHVLGKCEICGRRSTISRNMQDHKKSHHNIYFSSYLPTLAVLM